MQLYPSGPTGTPSSSAESRPVGTPGPQLSSIFIPDVQCAACKRVGHVAKHCDMLAAAIRLERYMKCDMSNSVQDAIKKDWLTRWKDCLENPDRMPCQVLCANVEELDTTIARLDDAMEWDCWADTDNFVSFNDSDK
jgi:hypothetical protein